MFKRSDDTATRFWGRIRTTDSCWLWTGPTNRDGYGRLAVYHRGMQLAHRISWELHNGLIPAGMNVLHHCDTPACVRPDHLYLGAQRENVRDMIARNRARFQSGKAGEANNNAKLNIDTVREIRQLNQDGIGTRTLARLFGVGKTTVQHIIRRDTWKHLDQ